MAEIYRVEKGSEEWKYKAYDYVRTDAFCLGQNIPIELEFGQDESKDDLQAILLTEVSLCSLLKLPVLPLLSGYRSSLVDDQ